MKSDLISVIVPVYNTAAYISRCIDSLLGQTYANIEIILVDDGSTDTSPAICDDYADKYQRVKAVHKENTGVSQARNIGISESSGSMIAFVDSDDYVHAEMFQKLYELLNSNERNDISVCGFTTFNQHELPSPSLIDDAMTFESKDALVDMLYQKNIANSVFGKLYRRNLFDAVEFPVGIAIAEDLEVNFTLFKAARQLIATKAGLYFYFRRMDSAMNAGFSSKRMQGLEVTKKLVEYTKSMEKDLFNAAQNRLFMEAIFILMQIPSRKEYRLQYLQCVRVIKMLCIKVALDNNAKGKYRQYAVITLISARLLFFLFHNARKRN